MARTLKVIKTADGEPGVKCPRCDEAVIPVHNEIFDGWNCPDCDQTISDAQMRGYIRHIKNQEDGFDDEDHQGQY